MRVARLYAVDDIRIEEEEVPRLRPGEALLRTRACGVCTGDLMGWYMRRKAPLVFGHEPTGEVAAVAKDVDTVQPGDRVFAHHHAPCGRCRMCLRGQWVHCSTWRRNGLRPGGMAEYFAVAAANLVTDTLKLPDTVGFEAGTLIEPTACVVKSLRRGEVNDGATVVVIGLGIMGLLHVVLAHHGGARVIAADMVPFRLARARELGAETVVNVAETDLKGVVRERTGDAGADVVIVGPGTVEAMRSGIDVAGPGSRVVLFTCAQPEQSLSVMPFRLYFDEVSLIPSYSCGPEDTRQALALIEAGVLPVDRLITHRFRLAEVQRAVDTAGRSGEALKTLVVFD